MASSSIVALLSPNIATAQGAIPNAGAQTTAPAPADDTAAVAGTAAANAGGIEDIVVTARRQKERLQDVPLVVTAITADVLQKGGIRNLRDLSYLTPGLTIFSQGAESNVTPVIRGVVGLGGGSGVSIFQDGINGGGSTTNLDLLDVERVEVVKGPVAAIYGGGAYSGAINYVSRRPSTDRYTGVFQGTYGNSGHVLAGYVSGPVIKDLLAVGVAGVWDKFSNLYKDEVNHNETGGYEKKDVRLNYLLTPAHNFEINGTFYYGKDSFTPTAISINANNCGSLITTGVTAGDYNNFCGEVKTAPPQIGAASAAAGVTGNSREVYYANIRMSLDLGLLTVNSLTSYNDTRSVRFNDFTGRRDGIPFLLTDGTIRNLREYYGTLANSSGVTQEVRLVSDTTKHLRLVAGGYYTRNFGSDTGGPVSVDGTGLPAGVTLAQASLRQYFTGSGATSVYSVSHSEGDSYAGFVGADLDVIAGLTVSGEARREKSTTVSLSYLSNAPQVGVFGVALDQTTTAWRGSAKYKVTPAIMVYAGVGRGEKAGGINATATVVGDATFGPEKNTTYEAGLKSTFLDNKLQANLSVFKVSSLGFQILGPASDPTNASLVTKNVGGAISKGVELDALLAPVKGVKLRFAGSYTDPKFKAGTTDYSYGTFCRAVPSCASSALVTTVTGSGAGAVTRYGVNLEGKQVPRTSKVTLSGGVEFDGSFRDAWTWYARTDLRYESKVYVDDTNLSYWGARFNTNAKIGVARGKYQVSMFVNNLTDNKTPEGALRITYLNDFNARIAAYLPLPRTYGVSAEIRF